jgi:hypothetical protein
MSPCTGETPSEHPDTSSSLDVQRHIPIKRLKKNKLFFLLTLFHEKLPFGKIYSSYLKLLRNFRTNYKHYTTTATHLNPL